MLVSLVKYEFKATYKMFLLLYALIIFFSFVNRFMIDFNGSIGFISSYIGFDVNQIALVIFMLIYFILMITAGILTIYITVKRFYSNIFGDSAYLMNTIPVAPWENILSKLFVGSFWILLGLFVCFISGIILITADISVYEALRGISELIAYIDIEIFDTICNFALCVIIQQMSNVMIIYCSMAIGHLFSKHRKAAAVGVFLIIQVIINTIIINIANGTGWWQSLTFIEGFNTVMTFGILFNMVVLLIGFFVTNYILKNKLNLE